MKILLDTGEEFDVRPVRSFKVHGELHTVFISFDDPIPGEEYAIYLLKHNPDGTYGFIDEELASALMPFVCDILDSGAHYYTESDIALGIEEL